MKNHSNFDAQVQWMEPNGPVHSDMPTDDREFLHKQLDEFLDECGGTGFFYIGDFQELKEQFNER